MKHKHLHLHNETLLHEHDRSGEAAHSADTPVSTSKPSDSKDLHLISTEEEEEEEDQHIWNVTKTPEILDRTDRSRTSRNSNLILV